MLIKITAPKEEIQADVLEFITKAQEKGHDIKLIKNVIEIHYDQLPSWLIDFSKIFDESKVIMEGISDNQTDSLLSDSLYEVDIFGVHYSPFDDKGTMYNERPDGSKFIVDKVVFNQMLKEAKARIKI